MPEPLSHLERQILDFLIEYVRRNTYQPSIREIGKRFDIKSTKTVSEYLQSLADKGWIERDPSRSRGVRLLGLDLTAETVTVPWFGGLKPEGDPLPQDAVIDEFAIDARLAEGPGAFLVSMRGASMEGAGILDGDLLLVRPADIDALRDGDIVVGRIGDEATVKRFFRRDRAIVLEPASANFPPTLVQDGDDFLLLGRVAGVLRRLSPAARVEMPEPAEADPTEEVAR